MVQLIKHGDIYTTGQASIGDKKYRDKTRRYIQVAQAIYPFLKERMTLPDDVKVVVGFTRGKRNLGFYQNDGKQCFIDPRHQGMWKFVDSMIHELTHAQQYFTGKLEHKYSRVYESWIPVWEDKEWGKYATSHKKYLAQPWEVEARATASKLSREIREAGILSEIDG